MDVPEYSSGKILVYRMRSGSGQVEAVLITFPDMTKPTIQDSGGGVGEEGYGEGGYGEGGYGA
jgi:hypothetical protein